MKLGGAPVQMLVEAALAEVAARELAAVRWVNARPRGLATRAVLAVTSPWLGSDLSVLVLACGLAALLGAGYRLFWSAWLAYVMARAVRGMVPGRRPCQVDYKLAPLLGMRGSGSVSLLVALAAVVAWECNAALSPALAAQVSAHPSSWQWAALRALAPWACAVLLGACALSRVAANVHFPHQVAVSALIGGGACGAARMALRSAPAASGGIKLAAAAAAFVLVLAEQCNAVENNRCEVRAANVPKQDYIGVLNMIWDSDATAAAELRSGAALGGARGRQPRDSFVKLIRSMERRAVNQAVKLKP
jgi:hypothetical protein